jgi:hypothetical protein
MICSRAEILTSLGLSTTATDSDIALINLFQGPVERLVKEFVGFEIEYGTFVEYFPDRGLFTPLDMLIEGYEGASGRAVPIERFRSDNRLIQLNNLPVRTVNTVYEDPGAWDMAVAGVPSYASTSQLFEGTDWMLDIKRAAGAQGNLTYTYPLCTSGFIFRRTGVWSNVERAVKISYNAGYTAAEIQTIFPMAKLAVLHDVGRHFNQAKFQRPNRFTGAGGGAVTSESIGGYNVSADPQTQAQNFGLVQALSPAAMKYLEKYQRYSQFI